MNENMIGIAMFTALISYLEQKGTVDSAEFKGFCREFIPHMELPPDMEQMLLSSLDSLPTGFSPTVVK